MLASWLGEQFVRAMCLILLLAWAAGKAIKSNPDGASKIGGFLWDLFRRK